MMKVNKCVYGLPAAWVALVLGLVLSLPVLAGDNRLSGTWEVAGTPDATSQVEPFVNLARISRDGGIVNVDPNEGAAVGDWEHLQGHWYKVGFQGFLPAGNGPSLRFKVDAIVKLAGNGKRFRGPFVTDVMDSAGNVVFSFGGEVEATRL